MPRKKKASARKATVSAALTIPKLKLRMPLDERKIAAIKRCLAKGNLTLTISRIDLLKGKISDPWLYD
jgi:hypothetical protein